MQAVADALSLLANLVMAWNTMKMQSVLDKWNARRSTAVPPQGCPLYSAGYGRAPLHFPPEYHGQSTGTFGVRSEVVEMLRLVGFVGHRSAQLLVANPAH
jgi:hypothetical protein